MLTICDASASYLALKSELDAAIERVCRSGRYILGPEVANFEREMADYLGCRYAIGVNSGTDALHLALRALRIGPGDEVITTPFTFVATTEAIGMVGATPVFVDIEPRTFNLDPAKIEAAITPRTRAILPVHLYGLPSEMEPILQLADAYRLHVVEDCAQALGARYRGQRIGTFGAAGCLSFFPSKNLGGFGDGGMVVTDSEEVYQRVEMLRRHGGRVKYHHEELGLNSRLDELQAAILRCKLPHLDRWNAQRRERAAYYESLLAHDADILTPVCPASAAGGAAADGDHANACEPVFHQYTIQVNGRDGVAHRLHESGIQTAVYYPVPLHLQAVHADLGYGRGAFPVAEWAAARCLSLPMFPELTAEQQQHVAACLRRGVGDVRRRAVA